MPFGLRHRQDLDLGLSLDEVVHRLRAHDGRPTVALGDPDRELRAAVTHALAHIEDERATPHLLRALRDTDREVRKIAAEALGDRSER